jgi:hypothetical protein
MHWRVGCVSFAPCSDAHEKLEFFHCFSITSIFGAMHELITQFSWKSRDESFELSWFTIGQYLSNKTKMILFIKLKFFQHLNEALVFALIIIRSICGDMHGVSCW